MKKMITMVIMLGLVLAPTGFAASPWTEEDGYKMQALKKLEFGLKNFLGGWTELINVPMDEYKASEDGAKAKSIAINNGVAQGLFNAVTYMIGGALHTATFFLPQVDVELPDNGVKFE